MDAATLRLRAYCLEEMRRRGLSAPPVLELPAGLRPGDLAAGDAVAWANSIGFVPDPWQGTVLESGEGYMLLNCSRQSGKSTTTALLALHTALYQPKSLILLLSPSMRQSAELLRKVVDFYRAIAGHAGVQAQSSLRLELGNGSRILSLPGNEETVRGYSGVRLLVVDEASRVPDELYYAVRPMLAVSKGRMVAMSTPFGKRGWWWKEWDAGGDTWKRIEVPATQCPRITAEFLTKEKRDMGDWWFDQEYMCRFLDAQTAAFTWDMVTQATLEEVESWLL